MASAPVAAWVARACWTAPLAVAGALKLWDPATFQERILDFQLVGYPGAGVISVVLPWIELSTSVAAWMPRWSSAARIWGILCFVMFVAVISQALIRGLHIQCGCFGTLGLSLGQTLIIDLIVIGAWCADAWLTTQTARPALTHT